MWVNTTSETEVILEANAGNPFQLVYRYIDYAENADKFWMIVRDTKGGHVYIKYGRAGSAGQVSNVGISLYDALTRKGEKVKKGYRFDQGLVIPTPSVTPTKPRLSEAFAGDELFSKIRKITLHMNNCTAYDGEGTFLFILPLESGREIIDNYSLT